MKKVQMTKSVQTLLDDIQLLGGNQREVVDAVRALIRRSINSVTEEVKYGGILFSSEVAFCGVFAYKEHVTVEFSQGAKIEDSLGYLEGTGKARRHIKLRTIDDISSKQVESYLLPALHAARKPENQA